MPIRTPITVTKDRLEEVMRGIARLLSAPVVVVLVAASPLGQRRRSPPSVAARHRCETLGCRPSAAASVAPVPRRPRRRARGVHVTTYGYSLMLPAIGRRSRPPRPGTARARHSMTCPRPTSSSVRPPASAWFFGAPTTKDLAARVKEIASPRTPPITAIPARRCPSVQEPIEIGGEPGVLLGYDCGILINSAITVHDGMAYLFGFRDPAVHAATSPERSGGVPGDAQVGDIPQLTVTTGARPDCAIVEGGRPLVGSACCSFASAMPSRWDRQTACGLSA